MPLLAWFALEIPHAVLEYSKWILNFFVAIGTLGETYAHLIPDFILPSKFRSPNIKQEIGKLSACMLVFSVILEVPLAIFMDKLDDISFASINTKNDELEESLSKIRDRTAWRTLNPDQVKLIINAIAPFAGQAVDVTSNSGDQESDALAQQFYKILVAAKWSYVGPPDKFMTIFAPPLPVGIQITLNRADIDAGKIPPAAATLANLFVSMKQADRVEIHPSSQIPQGQIEISVGTNPKSVSPP